MKKIFLLLLGLSVFSLNAQNHKINNDLKKELDEILRLDQTYRKLFDNKITPTKKSEILRSLNVEEEEFKKKNWQLVALQDSINIHKIDKIILEYGYPGKTLVGEPTNQAAWYVIQHSNKIGKYLPIIKEAGKKKEIPFRLVAMMEDRYLVNNDKEQIYGTQGSSQLALDKDGKEIFVDFIWPIKDVKNVNKRRKEAGFSNTVEENAKDLFGKEFKLRLYTLKEALKLRDQASKIHH